MRQGELFGLPAFYMDALAVVAAGHFMIGFAPTWDPQGRPTTVVVAVPATKKIFHDSSPRVQAGVGVGMLVEARKLCDLEVRHHGEEKKKP